jgi:hypothetical protein
MLSIEERPRRLIWFYLAPLLIAAVFVGVWLVLSLYSAESESFNVGMAFVAEFVIVALTARALVWLERPAKKKWLANHFRHCCLVYVLGIVSLVPLLTDNAGHLSGLLWAIAALTAGAVGGDLAIQLLGVPDAVAA